MSLMAIRRFFLSYATPLWILLALSFVAGSIALGTNSSGGGGGGTLVGSGDNGNGPIVATVGTREIRARELDEKLNETLDQQRQYLPTPPSPAEYPALRLRLLDQYKEEQAVAAAAQKAGITVSDADLNQVRDEAFQRQRAQVIQALQLKETATDRDIDGALAKAGQRLTVADLKASRFPEERIRAVALYRKLQDSFKAKIAPTATEQRVRDNYAEVKVRHVLIKTGEGGLPEEQARAKAQKILDAVKKDPASFARLADENTQDPGNVGAGGKKNGGLYDWRPAKEYVAAFSEAALSTKPGQIVPDLVKTPYGFHVMKAEGVRPGKDFPKDFDKNKQKYVDQFVTERAGQQAQTAVNDALPGVSVKVQDPALRAAQLQTEAQSAGDQKTREGKLNEALAELAKVKPADDRLGGATLARAAILEQLNRPKEAQAAYEEALKGRDDLNTRLALARLYNKDKNKTAAVTQLQAAEKMVRGDLSSQFRIAQLYREAGDTQRAAEADKKAAEMARRQAELSKASATPGGAITVQPQTSPGPQAPAAPAGGGNASAPAAGKTGAGG